MSNNGIEGEEMEKQEFDLELLELQEKLVNDPSILQSLSKEQKSKLIEHYSTLLTATKKENTRLKNKLDDMRQ